MTHPLDDVRAALEKLRSMCSDDTVIQLKSSVIAPALLRLLDEYTANETTIAELKAENERLRAKLECETCGGSGLMGSVVGFKDEGPNDLSEIVEETTCAECNGSGTGWLGTTIAQARAEAFEEAAKVADMWDGGEQYPATSVLLITDAIAATIRALAERKEIGS